MRSVTSIIVDDELHARKMLRMLLMDAEVEVEILAEADNAMRAVSLIREHDPQVVFLDIDMPGLSGIEMAELFGEDRSFEIIFITGHEEHATKAFRIKALDYLLKPISPKELDEALARLKATMQVREKPLDISDDRIALPMLNGLELVDTKEILMLEADRAYTAIKLKNGETKLVSKRLKLFEDLLVGKDSFRRIHRSYIVNMAEVSRYSKTEGLLVLSDGTTVPISKDRKAEMETYFNRLRP